MSTWVWYERTHLEPLVLQHLLNRDILSRFRLREELRLENDTKRAVPDHFDAGV